jgi:peptide/nickel transport system substrate-binding protein
LKEITVKRFKIDPKAVKARDELVREAHFQYSQNRISRREFLRFTASLGGGALAMSLLPTMDKLALKHARTQARQDMTPQRGGSIASALGVSTERFDDPAKLALVFPSNNVRQVCDYLVNLDPTLTLQPALATSWTPSEDGLTWTLTLREGVKFNHGKDFNADDVVFTINRLIDPETASGWAGAVNYVTGIEKVDDYTVNIFTNRVAADFIYSLFLYQAAILPADWPGDFFANPWGTGPFTVEEFSPAEYIRFRRREDYWQTGADGSPLPYLDTVEFDSYADEAARFSALQEGALHLAPASITLRDQYTGLTDFDFRTVQTGNLHIAIMQFDQEPWNIPEMREAMKLMVNRQAYADTLYLGFAMAGDDHPIAEGMYPLAPQNQTPRQQDYEQVRALLAQAGYPNGIDLTVPYIDAASDGGFAEGFAQFLVSQAEPAGIRMTLAPDPNFWDTWLSDWGPNVLGVSNWAQKNTASEMFNLAYYSSGVWNESHWSNAEFDALLEQFDSTLDQETRRGQLAQLCDLISNEGSVIIPGFRQDAAVIHKSVHYNLHPQAYVWFGDTWVEPS